MGNRKGWIERLAGQLNAQTFPGLPLVEIAGQGRVLIENHLGVCCYGREMISLRVSYGYVVVKGCDLKLAQLSQGQLVITGRIHSVCLEGENR